MRGGSVLVIFFEFESRDGISNGGTARPSMMRYDESFGRGKYQW